MGVTGKGNYKRGQEEQGEDLLGKETNQNSEARSGGGDRKRGENNTKPGMKPRCLKAAIPLLFPGFPTWENPPAKVSCPFQCLC